MGGLVKFTENDYSFTIRFCGIYDLWINHQYLAERSSLEFVQFRKAVIIYTCL